MDTCEPFKIAQKVLLRRKTEFAEKKLEAKNRRLIADRATVISKSD